MPVLIHNLKLATGKEMSNNYLNIIHVLVSPSDILYTGRMYHEGEERSWSLENNLFCCQRFRHFLNRYNYMLNYNYFDDTCTSAVF